MNIDIRFPSITGATPGEQLAQMKTYIHQLVEQLNWALNTVEDAKRGEAAPVVVNSGVSASSKEAQDTFNSIKALIIKSADIVKAYETTIFADFDGKYFAESDFGSYLVETNSRIEQNSNGVMESFSNIQTISGAVGQLEEEVRTTNAYIRRGLLGYGDDGSAIYGIEVGETSNEGAFRKYARFTADRLSFFDNNDTEIAYIGAGCLYVSGKAVFLGEIQLGGYMTDTSNGLAFTWIGG